MLKQKHIPSKNQTYSLKFSLKFTFYWDLNYLHKVASNAKDLSHNTVHMQGATVTCYE
jgi:hypothetical protein